VTGADALAGALEAAGVEVAFGLPGVHNLALWDALERSPIRLVGVRHEQATVYAADGYARATGRLGVALTTTGPGAANTLGALGEAWASRVPVLAIATDIPSTLRRPGVHRGVLHECVDQQGMFAPVVKESFVVGDGDAIAAATARAVAVALAAPARPVYLEVPTDLLGGAAEASDPGPDAQRPSAPDATSVQRAAALLASARRPLVWAGGGAVAAGAGEQVGALARALAAPVLTTYTARGLLGAEHPCDVGLPPHLPAVGALWDGADAVVAVGSDFDGMMTQNWAMPAPAVLVAVNVDPRDAAKNYPPDVLLAGDARAGLDALVEQLAERGQEAVDALAGEVAALRERALAELHKEHPDELAFLDAFARAVPDEAVVVCDMCIPGYWLGALHRRPAPRQLSYPLGWGTLGCAFPQALGAALAGKGPVVSVSGDGGFLYACGELATAAQERLGALTAVVVDDGGYGMLRYDQERAGQARTGVDLATPDFQALAESFAVRAETVDGLGDDFAAALERHIGLGEPSLLVARAALAPPPTTSPRWYRRSALSHPQAPES
jgi:acetolactate synthase-1/2/3 large subunit